MRHLRLFEEYHLERLIIKVLHEGVVMRIVSGELNEGLVDYANSELDYVLRKAEEDGDQLLIADFVPEIKSLVKKFSDSGQSGGSAPYTAGAITATLKKLLMFEPLSGVENVPSEWGGASFDGETYQNRRCSSVFKNGANGRPYYLSAIVFRGKNDVTFTSSNVDMPDGSKVTSRQYIKDFPFEPKTFVVDVDETEWEKVGDKLTKKEGGGWWTSVVRDPSQLSEVWEYYDRFEK